MQPSIIRSNLLQFSQPQTQNMYHPSVDKMNQNQQQNLIISPNYSIYPTNPTIQHSMPTLIPHIQPQLHSQMQQTQLPNQYITSHPVRMINMPLVNDKHGKTSLALEIINPETNKLIDLTLYKNNKNSKIEIVELKAEKHDFPEVHIEQNRYPEHHYTDKNEYHNHKANILETHDPVPLDLQKIPVDNTDLTEDQTGQISTPGGASVEENEFFESVLDKDINSESNIALELFQEVFQNPVQLETTETIMERDLSSEDLQDMDNNNVTTEVAEMPTVQNTIETSLNNGLLNKFIYSREELIKIGKNTLSRQKPKGLPFKDEFTDPIILDHVSLYLLRFSLNNCARKLFIDLRKEDPLLVRGCPQWSG